MQWLLSSDLKDKWMFPRQKVVTGHSGQRNSMYKRRSIILVRNEKKKALLYNLFLYNLIGMLVPLFMSPALNRASDMLSNYISQSTLENLIIM